MLAESYGVHGETLYLGEPRRSNGGRQLPQRIFGFVPSDAGVGYALPVDELFAGDQLLRSRDKIALKHHADDSIVAAGNLSGNVTADRRLPGMVLVAVGVTAIDHHLRTKPAVSICSQVDWTEAAS